MENDAYFKEWLFDPCFTCQYFCGYCDLPDGVECPDLEAETNFFSK